MGELFILVVYCGVKEVGFVVIVIMLVFIFVFVLLVFFEGNIGRLFMEFVLVIVVVVVFLSFIVFMLLFMMVLKIFKKRMWLFGFGSWMDKQFFKFENGYFNMLGKILYQFILMLFMFVIVIVVLVQFFEKVFSEFVFKEDRGNFFILMNVQEGVSFESNVKNFEKIESILMFYCESGKINCFLVRIFGFGGNVGIVIVGFVDWDE